MTRNQNRSKAAHRRRSEKRARTRAAMMAGQSNSDQEDLRVHAIQVGRITKTETARSALKLGGNYLPAMGLPATRAVASTPNSANNSNKTPPSILQVSRLTAQGSAFTTNTTSMPSSAGSEPQDDTNTCETRRARLRQISYPKLAAHIGARYPAVTLSLHDITEIARFHVSLESTILTDEEVIDFYFWSKKRILPRFFADVAALVRAKELVADSALATILPYEHRVIGDWIRTTEHAIGKSALERAVFTKQTEDTIVNDDAAQQNQQPSLGQTNLPSFAQSRTEAQQMPKQNVPIIAGCATLSDSHDDKNEQGEDGSNNVSGRSQGDGHADEVTQSQHVDDEPQDEEGV